MWEIYYSYWGWLKRHLNGESESSHFKIVSISFFFFLLSFFTLIFPQLFVKELEQWQGQVDETNALADKLLTLYANDDTHKVTQVNNNMVATWTHINRR